MYNMQQHFCLPFISAPSIQLILGAMSYELWVIISHGALLHLLGSHIYCWLWIPLNMKCNWEQNKKLPVKFTGGKNTWGCPFLYQMNLYLKLRWGKQPTARCFSPWHNNVPFWHHKFLDFSPGKGENCSKVYILLTSGFLVTRKNPPSMRCRCKEIFRLSANFKEVKKCGCWQVVFCAPGGYKSSWGVTDRTHL